MIPRFVLRTIQQNPKRRPLAVTVAGMLNNAGVRLLSGARELVNSIYGEARARPGDDFVIAGVELQNKIKAVLARYAADETSFKYFYDQPYQGLGIVNVLGDRLCDYRFDDYELRKFIKQSDRLLDVGCNCGFIAVLASYRTGCKSHGIDINPYMIEIGMLVADHLRLSDLVTLEAGSIHDFDPDPFDVVTCFATHWTDDNNYRVSIDSHMQRMARYLRPGGTLIFETHTGDPGNPEFLSAMDNVNGTLFAFDGPYKLTDGGTRELYVMKRL